MTNIFKDSRRDLRERAFQTLFALEFGGEALEQAHFAYTYDKPIDEETENLLKQAIPECVEAFGSTHTLVSRKEA